MLEDHLKMIVSQTKLPIKLTYNTTRGYYFQLATKHLQSPADLPKEFIKATKSKNFLSFTTSDLVDYNDKVTDITNNINLISNK
jgi:DNA mismatch repair ATPase MutS